MAEKKIRQDLVLGMRRQFAYPVIVFVVGMLLAGVAGLVNPNADFDKIGGAVASITFSAAVIGLLEDSRRKRRRRKDTP